MARNGRRDRADCKPVLSMLGSRETPGMTTAYDMAQTRQHGLECTSNSPDQSTAEVLMGRKLRIVHAAVIPSATSVHLLSVPKCAFANGFCVYARDYSADYPYLAQPTIIKWRGCILYDVKVEGEKWARHQNQLRPRHEQSSKHTPMSIPLPLYVLNDTFALPVPKSIEPLEPNLKARRWTNRVRRFVRPFRVNPKAKW
ncbi:unnamed protein product [Echinostoma caproni]|uniref:Uncharacterized protein n=1 Tax=Echinostoma caproni TaxID=27848 RepID=A0A183AQ83_9TREM|nr:unnamed protein product [Echinostoma caproni]